MERIAPIIEEEHPRNVVRRFLAAQANHFVTQHPESQGLSRADRRKVARDVAKRMWKKMRD